MSQVYIVEDDSHSIRQAVQSIAKEFPDVDIRVLTTPESALEILQNLSARKIPRPIMIVLDLDFGDQSGFEVLRYWRSSKSKVPIIVWTALGKTYQDISNLFGVQAVVSKLDGPQALIAAMASIKKTNEVAD